MLSVCVNFGKAPRIVVFTNGIDGVPSLSLRISKIQSYNLLLYKKYFGINCTP